MGTNHARTSRQLQGAQLVAVVDRDLVRAAAAAAATGARAVPTIDDVIGAVDAAVVAVPTPEHLSVALRLAEAGVHLLVEKPIAGNRHDAEALIAGARDAGVTLAVGHVERFNAAVAALPSLLEDVIHVEASRISPYASRVSDGVIFDLMIHDLDIVQSVIGADVVHDSIAGVARSVHGQGEDLASVTLRFEGGVTAAFNTSRLGQQKIRVLEITQRDSVVVADLVRQDVTIHRMTRHEYLTDEGTRYRQSSVVEIPFVEQRGEPLLRELQSFVDCVLEGKDPLVSGEDGLRAVDIAERIAARVERC
jgi:predicted dehydrogenase